MQYANKFKNRKEEGFTIIEVLIVLAIAGLILLIVFLAVPALQRNAHNTSIKNDVSGILGAVNEYQNNNNGATLPANTTVIVSGTASIGSSCSTASSNCATAKVGYLTGATVATLPGSIPTTAPTLGTVSIYTSATCNGNALASSTNRNVAAFYQLEGGAVQCQAS